MAYSPDRRGMRDLGLDPQVGAAMVDAAESGKRWAESTAPVQTGTYKGAFEVRPVTVQAGFDNEDRAGAELLNTAPHSHLVEAKHRILGRAVNVIETGGE